MPPNGTYKVADLCEAAIDGDVPKLRQILNDRPSLVNVYMSENNEHCAIHYAVMNQQADAVHILMEAGANYKSGIYPHREATDPFTIAQDRGYDDIV